MFEDLPGRAISLHKFAATYFFGKRARDIILGVHGTYLFVRTYY